MGKKLAVFCLVLFCLGPAVSFAEDSFTIAPPPVPHPYFEPGLESHKADLLLVSFESDYFNAGGLGVNYKTRHVMSPALAVDFAIGIFGMGGTFNEDSGTDGTLNLVSVPASLNLEVQPYANKDFNVILFAGPVIDLMVTNATIESSVGEDDVTMTMTQTLGGFQGGVQLGINMGDIMFSPYVMASTKSGSMTIDYDGTSQTSDVEPISSTTIGFDMEHLPTGITLSSLLQVAAMAEDDDGGDEESGGDTTTVALLIGIHW